MDTRETQQDIWHRRNNILSEEWQDLLTKKFPLSNDHFVQILDQSSDHGQYQVLKKSDIHVQAIFKPL